MLDMLRSMRALAPIFAIFVLASCTNIQPDTVSVPATAKTIAVVVSIPPQIRIATTGLTVFENALDVVDVPDWHLTEIAKGAAIDALSRRFQIVPASVDGTIVDSDAKFDKMLDSSLAIESEVRSRVHTAVLVDLYLVISLGNTAQPYDPRPNVYYGIGVSKERNMFRTFAPVAHTFLQMTILDGRTDKVIASRPLGNTPTAGWSSRDLPVDPLQGFAWKDYWHEMTDAQHDLIREHIQKLLATSVAYTIHKMNLVP